MSCGDKRPLVPANLTVATVMRPLRCPGRNLVKPHQPVQYTPNALELHRCGLDIGKAEHDSAAEADQSPAVQVGALLQHRKQLEPSRFCGIRAAGLGGVDYVSRMPRASKLA